MRAEEDGRFVSTHFRSRNLPFSPSFTVKYDEIRPRLGELKIIVLKAIWCLSLFLSIYLEVIFLDLFLGAVVKEIVKKKREKKLLRNGCGILLASISWRSADLCFLQDTRI